MTEQPMGQKDEKAEKQEEKEEKARGEKFRNDPLSGMAWAAVLIWVGVVFLLENMALGLFRGREAWPLIMVGAGVIFLLEAGIRLVRPEYRRPIGGTVIFAVILIGIGLGETFDWENLWPIGLIAAGVVLLVGAFVRRR